MGSVQPISVPGLNGVDLNPGDIFTDELVSYVGYVRNLCTDLGTKNDSSEGFRDFLAFQKEIESSRISTFEPDAADQMNKFDSLDLTGENDATIVYPITAFMMLFGKSLLMANGGGNGFTPFDVQGMKGRYIQPVGIGVTPFDETGGIPLAVSEPAYV